MWLKTQKHKKSIQNLFRAQNHETNISFLYRKKSKIKVDHDSNTTHDD